MEEERLSYRVLEEEAKTSPPSYSLPRPCPFSHGPPLREQTLLADVLLQEQRRGYSS